MSFYKEFNSELNKLRKESIVEVRNAATHKSKWLSKKINNYCKKWGYDKEVEAELFNKILENDFYATQFAKDPLKQNFAENFQLKFLNKYKSKDIKKLPSHGKKAYYLINGQLITNKTKKPTEGDATKSIDLVRDKPSGKEFYYAKYTNEDGGAQDNQFKDGCLFIQQADKYCSDIKDGTKFILLVDGPYYDRKKHSLREKIINTDRVFVMSCEEVIECL